MKLLLLLLFTLYNFTTSEFVKINENKIVNINSIPHIFNNTGISYHKSHVFDYSSLSFKQKNKFTYCSDSIIYYDNTIYNILSTLSKPSFITNLPCIKIFKITNLGYNFAKGELSTIGTIIPELDLTIKPLDSDNEKEKYFCLGLNVEHNNDYDRKLCNIPNNILSLYSYTNPIGLSVDLTCPECLVSIQGNIFIHIVIQTTKLAKVKAGFSNATLYTYLVINFNANEYYNIGLNKLIPEIKPTTIFSFSLLTIPLNFWFELPVTINGNLAFSSEGKITYGFINSYYYNDYSIEWTKDHPTWKMNLKKPTINKKTIFNTTDNIEVDSFLEIIPSLSFNLDNVFHSTIESVPKLNGNIYWDSSINKLCTNITTEINIDTFAEFDLDIKWLGLDDRYKWGPKNIYNSGLIEMISKCQVF